MDLKRKDPGSRAQVKDSTNEIIPQQKKHAHILITDAHPVMRVGIRKVLEDTLDFQVLGEAQDGMETQRLVEKLRPHILLLDLHMPGPRPSEIMAWIQMHCPETATLALTNREQDAQLADMVEAGAVGLVTKGETPERLLQDIRRVVQGEILFSQEQLARAIRWRIEVGQCWEALTARERQVLRLIALGQSNMQIAEALVIHEHTVETHVGNLFSKLRVASRAKAAAWVWLNNLAERLDIYSRN